MAKARALKLVKVLVIVSYIVIFLGLFGLQIWAQSTGSRFSVSSLIYWWVLFGWLGLIYWFKWGSSASLTPAFILFIIAALLTTVGLRGIGETVVRISFIGWMVGIVQALVEYKHAVDKKK